MKYFDYLETQWTISEKRLNVPPQQRTIEDQSRMLAVQALIDNSRKAIKYAYMALFLARILLIKLGLKKAPAYQSSIPVQSGKPDLSVVTPDGPASA